MRTKRWMSVLVAGTLVAGLMFAAPAAMDSLKGGTAMAAEAVEAKQRTIMVAGEGKLTIQPDVAYVNFGVFTKAATANEAQADNAKTMAAIEKVLKEQYNIAAKDVKTDGFYVQPEYTYPERGGQPTISGYTANHSLQVTYRELDKIGSLLDAVSKAGANRVNGIQFGTEKKQEYELKAIELAMANAEAKAEAIAKYSKRSLKGVLHVQQHGVSGGPPIHIPYARVSMAAESANSTVVQPGELEFTTTVNVTYEM